MTAKPYHSPESDQSVPESACQKQTNSGHCNSGKQAEAGNGWTFQSLLSAAADGDERRLFECISHLERRLPAAEKIFGRVPRRRTQVLSGLQDCVSAHEQQITDAQIRKYRKSEEGKRAAMIYHH